MAFISDRGTGTDHVMVCPMWEKRDGHCLKAKIGLKYSSNDAGDWLREESVSSGVTSLIDAFMTLYKEEYPLQGCLKSVYGRESLRKINRKKA